MKEIQKAQTLKEDVSSELEFFNRRYSESRNRQVQPITTLRPWIDRAKNPNPRPLGSAGFWHSRALTFGRSMPRLRVVSRLLGVHVLPFGRRRGAGCA